MKIAVLAGDGIGTEIVAQALKVLRRLGEDGLRLELEPAPVDAGLDRALGDIQLPGDFPRDGQA